MVIRRRVLTAGGVVLGGAVVAAGYRSLFHDGPASSGQPAELRIATGPAGAVYRGMGAALAEVLRARMPRTRIRLIPTDASLDNLNLLGNGGSDLGFVALDTAAELLTAQPDRQDLTAIGRLFDSWMQVLVRADSPIEKLSQLAGRPLAAGAARSGTRFGLLRLLETAGVAPRLVTGSQDAGAMALLAGEVDGFATFTGVPTPAVTRLTQSAQVRLLPLSVETNLMITRYGAVYTAATLPSATYRGVTGTATLTTPNLLLCRPGLSVAVARTVTAALFSARSRIARGHPEADQINIRTGIATMPVPLHPGATEYFRAAKP